MINRIDRKYRKFLQMEKRLNEIRNIKRKLPWRELEKPEQCGWSISFTLTPEGLKRPDAVKYLEIIKCCDKGFHLRKDRGAVVSRIRENKSFEEIRPLFTFNDRDGRPHYNGPFLDSLSEKEYDALPEILQRSRLFDKVVKEEHRRWGAIIVHNTRYRHKIPEHLLAVRVKKRMYTHVQDINPPLEREEKFIRSSLEEYWRESGGHRRWQGEYSRKHSKDAIKHFQKGDLSDVNDYHKLSKQHL